MTDLREELSNLAGDVGSTSGATAHARERARRAIVRHRRNQRAAVAGLATVVLAVGVTAAVALDRDARHSAPPAGETTVAPSSTTSTTSAPSTTTSTPPPFVNRSPYAVPPVDQLPLANAAYTHAFAWGKGDGQVSFAAKGSEGASGGPAAFDAGKLGELTLFDHSNARILILPEDSPPAARTVDMPSPAVTAAVFDHQFRLIAAFYNDLVVFDSRGKTVGSFPGAGPSAREISRLVVVGSTVYSVAEDGMLTAELHDAGTGYARPLGNAPLEPGAITLTFHQPSSTLDVVVAGSGRHYTFTGTDVAGIANVPAAQVLRDGSLVLVLGSAQHGTYDLDRLQPYEIVRVDPSGHASYARVDASGGYLTNGPEFVVEEDELGNTGVAAMSSTTAAGVVIRYFSDFELFR